MCIIAYSGPGVVLPKKTVLKRCWRKNSDGAGFAYLTEDCTWHIQKGFETWKAFWKAFNKHQFTKDDSVILHFRIGTSGKMNKGQRNHPDCTHPFPGTNDEELLMSHDLITETLFVHNGVCGTGDGDLSDTMVAIRDYGSALIPYISDARILDILGEHLQTNKCRWFVANKDAGWLLGTWVTDEETGILYSNKGYEKAPEVAKPNPQLQGAHVDRGYKGSWNGWREHETRTSKFETYIYCADSAKSFRAEDGSWDWDKWIKFDNEWNGGDVPKESSINEQKTIEVFSPEGDPLGIVDERGDVVWLDAYEDEQEEKQKAEHHTDVAGDAEFYPKEIQDLIEQHGPDFTFECTRCGNDLELQDLSVKGECSWCYEVLIPVLDDYPPEKCPSCEETKYIIDPVDGSSEEPQEIVGEATSECCRCGCMWKATNTVLGFNSHTRAAYITALDEQGGLI